MANYYTYGEIPSMYSEEPITDSPLSMAQAPGAVTTGSALPSTVGSMFLPGFTAPSGVDLNAPLFATPESQQAAADVLRDLYLQQQKQALALEPGLGAGYMGTGFLEGGLPITPEMRNIMATPAQLPTDIGSGVSFTPEQMAQLSSSLGSVFQPEVSAEDKTAIGSQPRVQALQRISDQLKANNFAGAFQTALDAEKELGGDFFDNIVNPDKMRMLRGPMTADEIRQFYESIPQAEYANRYLGPGNTYDVGQALERNLAALGGQPGYIDPRGGAKAKGSIVSDIVDIAPYVFAATVAPELIGALTGSTAAAAPYGLSEIPITATKIGAGGLGAAGTAGAVGTAAASLPEIVVTATKLGISVPEAAALLGTAGAAASATTGAAPTTPTTSTSPTGLEEIVVPGTRVAQGNLADIIPTLTAAQVAQMGTTPTSQIAESYQPTEVPEELPEIVVEGTKPVTGSLADIIPPLTTAQVADMGVTQPENVLKDYKPTDVRSPLDKIKDLLGSAGNINDVMKMLALLGGGAAAARTPSAGGVKAAPTGFGGALPKYQFQRTQLQPAIDYYRYGQGPEARFFEDKITELAPPPAEKAGIINPENQPVFADGGLANGGRYVDGPGSGREDKIPALLSDGEYVIDAETLALLGDGSPKEGARRMDKFRANIRQHKGRALSRGRISPDAKSPNKYMGGGLT